MVAPPPSPLFYTRLFIVGPGLTSELPHTGWSHAADIAALAPRRRILQQTRDNDRAGGRQAITPPPPGFISRYVTR